MVMWSALGVVEVSELQKGDSMVRFERIGDGLVLDRKVEPTVKQFLNDFHECWHYRRNVHKIFQEVTDWKAKCLFGVLGVQGEFYTGKDLIGADTDYPPYTHPTCYCGWYLTTGKERCNLVWGGDINEENEPEDVIEWLRYLILNVFEPLGYFVSGSFKCVSDAEELIVTLVYNKFKEIVEV